MTYPMALQWSENSTKILLVTVGSLVLVIWFAYLWSVWKRMRAQRLDPLSLLLEQLLQQFKGSLLLVSLSSLGIIGIGLIGGSQFSLVLFVFLTTLTISGIGLIAYWLWPKDTSEGNLFDLLRLPEVHWPVYENEKDRELREWVQERSQELKSNPPDFAGAKFGSLALEVSEKASKIYDKRTMLSVSVSDLLRGLERTAADMKLLTNQLPFAHQLTIADIERQIDFTLRRGRFIYTMLFLILSLVNPGNLIRVLLIFLQAKSPWEHLFKELRGWTYAGYFERLGYHMGLIYSEREPPPPGALLQEITEQHTDQEVQRQKISSLAALSLMGVVLYLALQITNAILVYGWWGFGVDLILVVMLVVGVIGLRKAERWERFWQGLLPKWPENPPPESEQDKEAQKSTALLFERHREPPSIDKLEEVKKLPPYYGNLSYEVWYACYQAYQHPEETSEHRAARELFLPQAFAGIEFFCRDLRLWYEGEKLLPRVVRVLEQLGLDLEALYLYLTDKEEKEVDQANTAKEGQEQDEVKQLTSGKVEEAESKGEKPEDELTEPLLIEALSPDEPKKKKGSFWKWAMGKINSALTDFATSALHKRIIHLLREEFSHRLIQIYGAKFPASSFRTTAVRERHILLLGRERNLQDKLLQYILKVYKDASLVWHKDDSDENFASEHIQNAMLCASLQTEDEDVVYHFYTLVWSPKERDKEQLELLQELLTQRVYHGFLLVDVIDYGARENVASFVQDHIVPGLRSRQAGSLALVLPGVEVLKPLRWDPPYDEYLEEKPSSRKAQRIRNAVLAWQKAFDPVIELDIHEEIFPVGLPKEGDAWGLVPLYEFLHLPKSDQEQIIEVEGASSSENEMQKETPEEQEKEGEEVPEAKEEDKTSQ